MFLYVFTKNNDHLTYSVIWLRELNLLKSKRKLVLIPFRFKWNLTQNVSWFKFHLIL